MPIKDFAVAKLLDEILQIVDLNLISWRAQTIAASKNTPGVATDETIVSFRLLAKPAAHDKFTQKSMLRT